MANPFLRRTVKFLHTVSGLGLVGGLAAYMLVLWAGPGMEELAAYAALRESLAVLARWLILPSMAGVVVSGLLAMMMNFAYMEAPWAWMKLLAGILVFEATLASVDGPARQAAKLSQQALAGDIDSAALAAGVYDGWLAWWVLLGLAVANVALATWRPKFGIGRARPEPEDARVPDEAGH